MPPVNTRQLVTPVRIALAAIGLIAFFTAVRQHGSPKHSIERILSAATDTTLSSVAVAYPFDGALFPPEIPAPTFRWNSPDRNVRRWLVSIDAKDSPIVHRFLDTNHWIPEKQEWETIKRLTRDTAAEVTIIGLSGSRPLARGTISFSTSGDSVGAPIFYREVNLPFIEAVKDPTRIRWRFGSIASLRQPPVVLDNLPVCGNCHSFSADGKVMGMDVDYANDKGSYAIAKISTRISLDDEKVISWSDFRRADNEPTYGLLSQVSPDGRFVASTVKDRSVFVPRPGIAFSQLFFPVKGIVAVYDRSSGTFGELPGADDRAFVNSNPVWSPDGQSLLFTRAPAHPLRVRGNRALLTPEECAEFLDEGKPFKFDIYRVPFNDGRGGRAVALKGASHNGKSNYFPRYSPDGKWIVFCQAANYSLLQPDSRLYIMPSSGGAPRLMDCNRDRMNSWHSFSPNGRWLVFSSKAFSPYTQLFLTHIDENGIDAPPVLLENFTAFDRAANIPEFVNASPDAIAAIIPSFVDDTSFVRAALAFQSGRDLEGALSQYRKALAINPRNTDAHVALGLLLLKNAKRYDEAEHHFRAAISIDSSDFIAHGNLANLLFKLGRHDESYAIFRKVLSLKPEDGLAHYNFACLLEKMGRHTEAIDEYKEALRINPASARAHNNLGLIYEAEGETERAVSHYREALKRNPDLAQARDNLARVTGASR